MNLVSTAHMHMGIRLSIEHVQPTSDNIKEKKDSIFQ